MNNGNLDELKAERRARIQALNKEKAELVKEAARLLRKPARRPKTIADRLAKAITLLMRAQQIEFQQMAIDSQPIPKGPLPSFQKGSIGESGPELVEVKDGVLIHIGPQKHPLQFPGGFEFK